MKVININNKYNSLRVFTPQKIKIVNCKLNFHYDSSLTINTNSKELKSYKRINKTIYSNFKPKELSLTSTHALSNDSNHHNKLSQCIMINNRYNTIQKTDFVPLINNFQINNSKNFCDKTKNYSRVNRLKTEIVNNKYNINLINTAELTKISSLLSSLKYPKEDKKIKKSNLKNTKYNSLLYHLNKNTKLKENEMQNRYRPIMKEFFGKKDYLKFSNKSVKFIRPKELKTLYKDTKLIKTIFDYLNNSFLKIRYHQAKMNQQKMNELLENQKKEKFYRVIKKENNLLVDKCFQIKKLIFKKKYK